MTLEEFQTDLEARLATMSDDEFCTKLENAGCVFADPWLETYLANQESASVPGTAVFMSANSSELALAA